MDRHIGKHMNRLIWMIGHSKFSVKNIKMIKQHRSQSIYGIIASLFLLSGLVVATMILPLAYAQQITTINNPGADPIKHIVVIMQENRSFDNYFGTYPGANGIAKGTCVPLSPKNPTVGCVKPYLSTDVISGDLPHGY